MPLFCTTLASLSQGILESYFLILLVFVKYFYLVLLRLPKEADPRYKDSLSYRQEPLERSPRITFNIRVLLISLPIVRLSMKKL